MQLLFIRIGYQYILEGLKHFCEYSIAQVFFYFIAVFPFCYVLSNLNTEICVFCLGPLENFASIYDLAESYHATYFVGRKKIGTISILCFPYGLNFVLWWGVLE